MARVGPAPGGGGILKSNASSADNTLAHPYAGHYDNYSVPEVKPKQLINNAPPNPGGIVKSNISSAENPLAYGGYSQQPAYQQPSYQDNHGSFQNNSELKSTGDPSKWLKSNSSNEYSSNSAYAPLESFRKPNENQISSTYDQFSGYSSAPVYNSNPNYDPSSSYQQENVMSQSASNSYNHNTNESEPYDMYNKQAYKLALDKQVAEKEHQKHSQEQAKRKSELEYLNKYPFGRRADGLNEQTYKPSFGNQVNKQDEVPPMRLNKDNIVEKPNSLVADVPPYDPIKHRTGFHQGYNYDPWGKPGGGAPLIDPNTGRKFTKYSGQIWYDAIGLSPDDRAKFHRDKNRPLTLAEQKNEIEIEKQRKKYEEAVYKSRAGDVATWITEIENQRKNNSYGAHLQHTNVTREKINLEYARKNYNENTKNYHDELGMQLEERYRNDKLHKLKDDVAGIEHTRKWDDWWGKPGGGAPNYDKRRKDLQGALESPRDNDVNYGTGLQVGGYNIHKLNDDRNNGDLVYAKNTVRSNHRNLYDNIQKMK